MERRLMSTRTKMKNYKQMNTTYCQNTGCNTRSCQEYIPHPSKNTVVYASIDHKQFTLKSVDPCTTVSVKASSQNSKCNQKSMFYFSIVSQPYLEAKESLIQSIFLLLSKRNHALPYFYLLIFSHMQVSRQRWLKKHIRHIELLNIFRQVYLLRLLSPSAMYFVPCSSITLTLCVCVTENFSQ